MVSSLYYEILNVPPGASFAEIKAAYHRAAKDNHPDLFPETDRERYEMRMMQVNEAYMALVCERADSMTNEEPSSPTKSSQSREHVSAPPPDPDPDTREIGQLRDPAYTYYKLGFKYFSEGRRTLAKHYLSGEQRIDFSTENIDVLRHAVASLHYFHKAYNCFEKVASEYQSSVWSKDSRMKIYYLNRYNVIYQRICDNLSRQIALGKATRSLRSAKSKQAE